MLFFKSSLLGDEQIASNLLNISHRHSIDRNAIHSRGIATIDTIYGALLPKIFTTWGSHQADVAFMEHFTVYGLYLSDFEILDAVQTELIVLVSMLALGFAGPMSWHIRGMGRVLGARDDVTDDNGDSTKDSAEQSEEKSSRRRLSTAEARTVLTQILSATAEVVQAVGPKFVEQAHLSDWPDVEGVEKQFGGWGDDPWTP